MDRPAVLLLERNASVIEVAQRCLPGEVELHVAKTVEMGLRIAARRAPAVVVLDTSMAGTSPADTVSRLRAHHPSLRVVFLVEPMVDVDRRYTQLGFVLRKLRWDGEEALSRVIGDIAAHRAVGTVRSLAGWHRQTAQNLLENLAEYFGEEQPVLVKRHALEDFSRTTTVLRDDLARLEKRLRKLESRN